MLVDRFSLDQITAAEPRDSSHVPKLDQALKITEQCCITVADICNVDMFEGTIIRTRS